MEPEGSQEPATGSESKESSLHHPRGLKAIPAFN
jgi:hypothetical protein